METPDETLWTGVVKGDGMASFSGVFKASLCQIFLLFFTLMPNPAVAGADNYHHLVLLGDPHLPGKHIERKHEVIDTINTWDDVSLVVALGDATEALGNADEYTAASAFLKRLSKPLCVIAGNHDFYYEDQLYPSGKKIKASIETRALKLERFRTSFGLNSIYYSKQSGRYRLVFLSTDSGDSLASLSDKQFSWLEGELKTFRNTPTVIFFHAPLDGTLTSYNSKVNTRSFTAQPADRIDKLLSSNPQVFLWISGHTHTPPREPSFASAVNLYKGHVTNIHNTDMNRETIWTNSLFLYQDRVVVRTYNHRKKSWVKGLERVIVLPDLSQNEKSPPRSAGR